jgi:hypothetical protein
MKLQVYNETQYYHEFVRAEQRPGQWLEEDYTMDVTQQKYISFFIRSCVGLKAWRNLSNVVTASVVLVAASDAERSRPCCGS